MLKFDSLVDVLRYRVERKAEERVYTFLKDGHKLSTHLTYQELDFQARAIAVTLNKFFTKGQRAILLYPPGLEFAAAFFGCMYSGIIAVAVYPPDPARLERSLPKLLSIVEDSQPKVVLTTSEILSMAEYIFGQEPQFKSVKWVATDKPMNVDVEEWKKPALSPSTIALLQYTSGSTSSPKGVMVSHGNILHNLSAIYHCFEHSSNSRGVIWLPLYHDMGLVGGLIQPLYSGFPVTLLSPLTFLQKPLCWLQAISNTKATTSGGPNFAYELCTRKITAEQKAGLDLSSWDLAFNGAEPIHWQTMERFANAFAECGFRREAFYTCYGLAEATLIASGGKKGKLTKHFSFSAKALKNNQILPSLDGDEQVLVSSGNSVIDQQILVVNPSTLKALPEDEIGEIWVKGPSVAQGYWQNSEVSKKTFQAYTQTGEGPFLRTGDLGFFHQGELFITGRSKDLIIIRGRNHYPQDIELIVENSHPFLRPGCSAAFSIETEDQEELVVVAEVDKRQYQASLATKDPSMSEAEVLEKIFEEIISTIRSSVTKAHNVRPHAIILIKSGTIYKTSSGKIQRYACRSAFQEGILEVLKQNISVKTAKSKTQNITSLTRDVLLNTKDNQGIKIVEQYLQAQLSSLLKIEIDCLPIDQPISSLGLDSVMIATIKEQIALDLEVDLPLELFFQSISLEHLSGKILNQILKETNLVNRAKIIPRNLAQAPLSYEQQRFWFLEQFGNAKLNNISAMINFTGKVDLSLLKSAINDVIARHNSLQTVFKDLAKEPVQIIAKEVSLDLPLVDLSLESESEKVNKLNMLFDQELQQRFELTKAPLLRVLLVKLDETQYRLILTTHHIISDGWSIGILVKELATIYQTYLDQERSPLSEPFLQYSDFTYWQREQKEEYWADKIQHWQKYLSQTSLLWPTEDKKASPLSYYAFDLPTKLIANLKSFCSEQNATAFMVLLAGFKILLYSLSGQKDIVVGVPVSGRFYPEVKNLIGLLAYPIPIRTLLSEELNCQQVLWEVREASLIAYANEEVPFAKIVSASREKGMGYKPLFQTMFGLLSGLTEKIETKDLSLTIADIKTPMADCDLFMTLFEGQNRLHGSLGYNTSIFDVETINLLVTNYINILEQVIEHPETKLSNFDIKLNTGKLNKLAISELKEVNITPNTSNPIERKIAQICSNSLGLNHLNINSSLTEIMSQPYWEKTFLPKLTENFKTNLSVSLSNEMSIVKLAEIVQRHLIEQIAEADFQTMLETVNNLSEEEIKKLLK